MTVTTAEEIRRIEVEENEIGTDFLTLMEKAGTGCAGILMEDHAPEEGPVAVFCGSGKNGGDGFVIARKLLEQGYSVSVIRAFGPAKAEDAVTNETRALEAGVPVLDWGNEDAEKALQEAAVLVDCLFGIGFRGAANELQAQVFCALNEAPGTVLSVDVPSGVLTDSGAVEGVAVYADKTIAISTLKPLHVFYPGREYCGDVCILDIGLKKESYAVVEPTLAALSEEEAKALLPVRSRTAHKNDAGHVLSLCGSRKMPGAACLAASAAARAGAGLVTAAYPETAYPAIASQLTECMSLPLPAAEDGTLSRTGLSEVLRFLEKASVLVAGPGLGQSSELREFLMGVLAESTVPMVLDADALNLLSRVPEALIDHEGPLVLTPHPGEMARLTGLSVKEIQKDRPHIAKQVADRFGATVLLKGPDTVIASPETDVIWVNTTGNQGLAKGGSGDTLAGMLGAFLAQGAAPFDAARAAAWYHGKAAEHCGETMALRTLLASDLIAALPFVLPD